MKNLTSLLVIFLFYIPCLVFANPTTDQLREINNLIEQESFEEAAGFTDALLVVFPDDQQLVTLRRTIHQRMAEKSSPAGQYILVDLDGGVEMEFVWIEALNAWVGKYEVTNAEFRRFRSGHDSRDYEGHSLNGDRQPVVRVSYEDAVAFSEWLSGRDGVRDAGASAHLLTGDQWTAIARCGTNREYPWGNSMPPTRGNYADEIAKSAFSGWIPTITGYNDGFAVTAPVEQSGRNKWGLYGVGGNVWEWTSEQDGSSRVLRGASWFNRDPDVLRAEYRGSSLPSGRSGDHGFRVLLSP